MRESALIILGSGPAGYTAALYAARANLSPLMIAGVEEGGQLMTTTDVENWPGSQIIQGPELMENMKAHVEKIGVEIINDHIESVDFTSPSLRLTGSFDEFCCDALIVAAGASAIYLGLESEAKYLGRGVSGCATCDGFFYKQKPVMVVGGGNTAVEEALYLGNIVSQVTLIHRRDKLRAEKILQKRLFAKAKEGNIKILWNSELEEVVGDGEKVTAAKIRSKNGATSQIELDAVFIAIGHHPNTAIFEDWLDMDNGYLKVQAGQRGNATQTSREGVFAAGDVIDQVYRQAITSAGSGCMAALDAENYLATKASNHR